MSLSICAECFARLRITSRGLAVPSRAFTTTSTKTQTGADLGAKRTNRGQGYRESVSYKHVPKPRGIPKLPAIGELRALRKRIVLSNTNAFEIPNMQDLSAANMTDEAQVGRVLGLNGDLLDQLREVRAFKTTQNWQLFRRPGTLMRRESVQLGRTLSDVDAGQAEERPRTVRQIIVGERNTGKSLMLLQAMSMAFMNNWVVINVPEGQEYTIANSMYKPMDVSSKEQPLQAEAAQTPSLRRETSQQMIYDQPKLTADLLKRISNSNKAVLQKLSLAHAHKLDGHKPTNLHGLAVIGVEDSKLSWRVWQALWKELTSPSSQQKRPPILVALDDIDHWMTLSRYRSAEFNPIHAHQLAPIRHFLHMLFNKDGVGQLANGGMILAARTASNGRSVPTFDLVLRQLDARQKGLRMGDNEFPMPQPYKAVDPLVLGLFEGSDGLSVQTLKGLERDVEARGLLEHFARSGLMREAVSAATVAEKWTLAGGGVVGELTNLAKRLRVGK